MLEALQKKANVIIKDRSDPASDPVIGRLRHFGIMEHRPGAIVVLVYGSHSYRTMYLGDRHTVGVTD